MPIPIGVGRGTDTRRELLQRIVRLPIDDSRWRRTYKIAERLGLQYQEGAKPAQCVDVFALIDRTELCVYGTDLLRAFVIATPYDIAPGIAGDTWSYCYEQNMYDESHGPVLATGDDVMPIALAVWRGLIPEPEWMQAHGQWAPKRWTVPA